MSVLARGLDPACELTVGALLREKLRLDKAETLATAGNTVDSAIDLECRCQYSIFAGVESWLDADAYLEDVLDSDVALLLVGDGRCVEGGGNAANSATATWEATSGRLDGAAGRASEECGMHGVENVWGSAEWCGVVLFFVLVMLFWKLQEKDRWKKL